jgi:dephospho-CoA kinase
MLRVGLTGGIASGKSLVLARLAAAGCHTLDLDRVAHELMAPGGGAYAEVVAAFGAGILSADRSIDRRALGAVVFADAAARSRLNAIVHPQVRAEEARRAALHASDAGAVFVTDAALLVESGVHLRFDRLVVVYCDEAEQLRRLMARDGIDEDAARARIAAQMPAAEKRRFAHFEVDASKSLDETARAADRLAEELRRLATAPPARAELRFERALGALVHGPRRGPRGLDPVRLMEAIAKARGIEMERIAGLLIPPASVPWYTAATPATRGPTPVTLMAPVVLWALSRGAHDPEFVAAAAASLARLTHRDREAVSAACLFALALQEVVATGSMAFDDRLAMWTARAERWGGVPTQSLAPVFAAARLYPTDVAAARASCLREGGDPDLAGAVVGAHSGEPASAAPPPLVAALGQLLAKP